MATQNTGGIRSIVIKPGEKYILPPGAEVTSLVLNGAINVTSSCDDLPPPTVYSCGYFYIILDKDDNNLHSMDELDTYYTSIKVGTTTYTIGRKIIASGDNDDSVPTNATVLNTHITDKNILIFTAVGQQMLSKRQGIWLYFKAPKELMTSIELKVSNHGSPQYYKPEVGVCGEYPFGTLVEESFNIE